METATRIGAKELRANLDAIIDRVVAGEAIMLTHRFKSPIMLQPLRTPKKGLDKLKGLAVFDAAKKGKNPYVANIPLKELYARSLEKKYGS